MGDSQQSKPQNRQQRNKKRSPEVEQHQAQHESVEPANLLEAVFASIPDAIIVYDLNGKILRMNPAALILFELASENLSRGTSYHQFLRRYEICDENQQPIPFQRWPMSRVFHGDTTSGVQEDTVLIRLPSRRNIPVTISCAWVADSQHHRIGAVCVFHSITDHRWNELRARQINISLLTLIQAMAHIPTIVDRWSTDAIHLLPPSMNYVGQHLVDLIGQILECDQVFLLSLGPPGDHLYYVAMQGLTPEQEQRRQEISGRFALSDFLDETTLADLSVNKEVSITTDRLHLPFLDRSDLESSTMLLAPIFLGEHMAGILVIARADLHYGYTSEERTFVRAVATLIALVMECASSLSKLDTTNAKEAVLQGINQLINEFLNLASHELRTPLTVTMGNIQLAQRRLEGLKRDVTDLSETVSRKVEQVQQPLESASQSARLQERIIRDMTDDIRIQTHTLTLYMKRHNLIELVREAVFTLQQQAPERRIMLEIKHEEETVPIVADADRIKQVINTYLKNALNYSPGDQPVTVKVTVEGSVAHVSVHDEGPGIPPEEQVYVWKRFYRAKGIAVQHELDLSLGLSLYICQELMKYHHGNVGLQSVPGHGSIFWFTLPIATRQKGQKA